MHKCEHLCQQSRCSAPERFIASQQWVRLHRTCGPHSHSHPPCMLVVLAVDGTATPECAQREKGVGSIAVHCISDASNIAASLNTLFVCVCVTRKGCQLRRKAGFGCQHERHKQQVASEPVHATDTTVALFIAVFLFTLPHAAKTHLPSPALPPNTSMLVADTIVALCISRPGGAAPDTLASVQDFCGRFSTHTSASVSE